MHVSLFCKSEGLLQPSKPACMQILAQPKKSCCIAPRKLVRVIQQTKPEFHSPMHQDAQELLSFLLNHVSESMRSLNAQIEADRLQRRLQAAGVGPSASNGGGGEGGGAGLVASGSSNFSAGSGSSKRSSRTAKSSVADAPTLIDEIFVGRTVTNTLCVLCENLSRKMEDFKEFQIEIQQPDTTLERCMGVSRCAHHN
jgi:ubiquitin C-terminal hydrolase